MALHDTLTALLDARGLSQRDLHRRWIERWGEEGAPATTTLSAYFTGRAQPSLERLRRMLALLDESDGLSVLELRGVVVEEVAASDGSV